VKTRHNEHYENDNTPSYEIARKYRESIREDDHDGNLALISYRGGEVEFNLGKEYCSSDDAGDRVTGAAILAQLGWCDQTFRDQSIEILSPMLADPNDDVIQSAAIALGHRRAASAIPAIVRLADHLNSDVRYGVAYGLLGHEDSLAIEGLIKLAADDDRDVRNWSVFGLGSQIETDSPAIREALKMALGDLDQEIRGEALMGLAVRKDPDIVLYLTKEWDNDIVSLLSIEAAEETRDSRLLPYLKEFTEDMILDDDPHFASVLGDAITACTEIHGYKKSKTDNI